jgi:hypothetical protein
LPAGTLVDGELVAFGPDGCPDLPRLLRRHGLTDPWRIRQARHWYQVRYVLFDLHYHAGRCLVRAPLARRREVLAEACQRLAAVNVWFSEGVVGQGKALYAACLCRSCRVTPEAGALCNAAGRDAQVAVESVKIPVRVRRLDKDGRQCWSARILNGTLDRGFQALLNKYAGTGHGEPLADALIAGDPEVDFEAVGMFLRDTKRVDVDAAGHVVHAVTHQEIVRNPDGSEKLRRPLAATDARILEHIGQVELLHSAVGGDALALRFEAEPTIGLLFT